MSSARVLRGYLGDGKTHLAVGGYDALTARVADVMGAEVLHLTGFGASAALAGVPDIGLLSVTEMVDTCRRMCEASDKPLIADADTGHGNPLNVRRTVRAFEGAGAAAVHIEDQVAPKRCGHMAGKSVVPTSEMVEKVKAAVDARRDEDFVIIARTDARAIEGIDAAFERAAAYKEAGADVLFVEALRDRGEIERSIRELPRPQLLNWAFDGLSPHSSRAWVEELGFELLLFADVASVVHRALVEFHGKLQAADSLDELAPLVSRFDDFNEFVGLSDWRALEQRYAEAGSGNGGQADR